jgi:hypothetical protein
MIDLNKEQLLDRRQAAEMLRVAPSTLAVWDCTRRYDHKPIKIDKLVRYRKSDLDKFIFNDNQAKTSPSHRIS